MNPFVMILLCTLAALMVMFGNNPVEEARKEREKRLAGIDPLIESIQEHNKKSGMMGGLLGGRGGGYSGGVRNDNSAAMMMRSGQNPNAGFGTTNTYGQPEKPPQSYYPPPPSGTPGQPDRSNKPRSELPAEAKALINLSARSKSTITMRSGQEIGFAGRFVYTMDPEGKPVPMPDGTYVMNGGYEMRVVNGRKLIIPN